MALSWNEIKDRALKFSNEWVDETCERAEKDTFWNDFFNLYNQYTAPLFNKQKTKKRIDETSIKNNLAKRSLER